MKITITRKEQRNQLTCSRADGTCETENLGPGLPHHDLAHYVVEKQFGLERGFFGNIARGYSFKQLADKYVIKTLDREVLVAEILARALQALSSGACTVVQYPELVNAELANMSLARLDKLDVHTIETMQRQFGELTARYTALRNGEALELEFDEQALAGA